MFTFDISWRMTLICTQCDESKVFGSFSTFNDTKVERIERSGRMLWLAFFIFLQRMVWLRCNYFWNIKIFKFWGALDIWRTIVYNYFYQGGVNTGTFQMSHRTTYFYIKWQFLNPTPLPQTPYNYFQEWYFGDFYEVENNFHEFVVEEG